MAQRESDLEKLESAFAVSLPADYRMFMSAERDLDDIDDTTVVADAGVIIEMTREYQAGAYGNKPWPTSWLYVGDEADSSPYVLDCANGRLMRLHKGDPDQPFEQHDSFGDFLRHRQQQAREPVDPKEARRRDLFFYAPAAVALFVFFVVLPVIVYSVSELFKWLTR